MRVASWLGIITATLTVACTSGSSIETGPSPSATVASGAERGVETSEAQGRSTAATLGIPPGHLPPPGQCRIWEPGRPPGHQRRPGPCRELERQVRRGDWLVYRPTRNKKQVVVRIYGSAGPTVSLTRWFDIVTGRLLREEGPS